MTQRIQRQRTKGWRMPPDTVSVTRPGRWGNPFVVGREVPPLFEDMYNFSTYKNCPWYLDNVDHLVYCVRGSRVPDATQAVRLYRQWLTHLYITDAQQLRDLLAPLQGYHLACFCAPGQPCHADVLLEFVDVVQAHTVFQHLLAAQKLGFRWHQLALNSLSESRMHIRVRSLRAALVAAFEWWNAIKGFEYWAAAFEECPADGEFVFIDLADSGYWDAIELQQSLNSQGLAAFIQTADRTVRVQTTMSEFIRRVPSMRGKIDWERQ